MLDIKLLTKRHYNRDTFKNTLKIIWKLVKPVRFYEPGLGYFIAEFDDESDKKHVQIEGPCTLIEVFSESRSGRETNNYIN